MDAPTIITRVSKRALWRRPSDGQITRQDNGEEGRIMLTFEESCSYALCAGGTGGLELAIEAAAGDSESQNDLALLFLDADNPELEDLTCPQLAAQNSKGLGSKPPAL